MNKISKMNDEELYLKATAEVEGESKILGLWAKVMALTEGNETKAKYKYIKLRVEQLANEKKVTAPEFTKKTVDEFDLKYMPVVQFSRIKSIPEDKVIKMIRDGFYVGQIKNKEWYVSREEVGANDIPKQISRASQKTDHLKEYILVEEFSAHKGITSEKVIQMIRDGFYQGRIIEDKWYVAYSEIDSNQSTNISESTNFFSRLSRGEFGLAKTYWLYGIFVSVIASIIITNLITSLGGFVILTICYTAYEIPVLLGVWCASENYIGPKVWAVLAKIAVILGWVSLGVSLLGLAALTNT